MIKFELHSSARNQLNVSQSYGYKQHNTTCMRVFHFSNLLTQNDEHFEKHLKENSLYP